MGRRGSGNLAWPEGSARWRRLRSAFDTQLKFHSEDAVKLTDIPDDRVGKIGRRGALYYRLAETHHLGDLIDWARLEEMAERAEGVGGDVTASGLGEARR